MKIITTSIAYSNKCLESNPNFLIKDITIKSCDEDIWFLAPTWELVEKYKSDQISEEQYTNKYLDLIKIGIKPGKKLGMLLSECLNVVIDDPELNDKEYLLRMVKNINQDKGEV